MMKVVDDGEVDHDKYMMVMARVSAALYCLFVSSVPSVCCLSSSLFLYCLEYLLPNSPLSHGFVLPCREGTNSRVRLPQQRSILATVYVTSGLHAIIVPGISRGRRRRRNISCKPVIKKWCHTIKRTGSKRQILKGLVVWG